MRARAINVLKRVCRPLINYLTPGAIVLGYHRVSNTAWDPLRLAISKENFRSQLDVIADNYDPVSLDSLVAMKQRGASLKGYISITFDDGCDEFVNHAVPELVCRNIPVTIFVTTGYAGDPFWWDEVSHLLSPDTSGVDKLEIDIHEMGGERVFENLRSRESAAEAVREICRQLLNVEPSARSNIIEQIRARTSEHGDPAPVPHAMTQEHLQELSRIPLLEIGAHSVTHPLLAQLSELEQIKEIQNSKSELEVLGTNVVGFSYPNGSFSQQTCDLVEHCGFHYACTSRQAAVRRTSSDYQLPRIWVPNVGNEKFRRWISAWTGL